MIPFVCRVLERLYLGSSMGVMGTWMVGDGASASVTDGEVVITWVGLIEGR